MKIFEMNGHKIRLPDDMRAQIASHDCAGDYDSIFYKGYEILTFEDGEVDSEGFYIGPFDFGREGYGPEFEAKTLDEVRAKIDAAPAA